MTDREIQILDELAQITDEEINELDELAKKYDEETFIDKVMQKRPELTREICSQLYDAHAYTQQEWDFLTPQKEAQREQFLLTASETKILLSVLDFIDQHLITSDETSIADYVANGNDIISIMEMLPEETLTKAYEVGSKIFNNDYWCGIFTPNYYDDGTPAGTNEKGEKIGRCFYLISNEVPKKEKQGAGTLKTKDKYPELYEGVFTITSKLQEIKNILRLSESSKYISLGEFKMARFIVDYYNNNEFFRAGNDHSTRALLSRKTKTAGEGSSTQAFIDFQLPNNKVQEAKLKWDNLLKDTNAEDFVKAKNTFIKNLQTPSVSNLLMILENHNYLSNRNTNPEGDITFKEIADYVGVPEGSRTQLRNEVFNALEVLKSAIFSIEYKNTTYSFSFIDANETYYNRKAGTIHYKFSPVNFKRLKKYSALYPRKTIQIPQNKNTARLLVNAFIQHDRLNFNKRYMTPEKRLTLSIETLTGNGAIKTKEAANGRVNQIILQPFFKDLEYLVSFGVFKSYKLKHNGKTIPKGEITKLKYDTFIKCVLTVELVIQPCYPELNTSSRTKPKGDTKQ